ncbi:MAG: sigma-70 family RNA polymerase sigma factor, partial [Candidatus Poribacteria bacterium]
KKQDFDQLSDDMIAETPSVDDSLILRETLAKVMQAIDGLPEMEKQLLKERYLDDASYTELQARHGLSYKALNMRLLRAKRKVREQVTKMLAGVGIFSWQDALKKMLLGGVETVKISAKVKIIAIGVGAVLILGGTGIMLWHQQQPEQIISEPAINQAAQKVSVVSSTKPVSSKKDISDKQKLKDNQNEDVQKEQAIVSQDSLEKDGQEKATVKGISEEKKSADSERKIRGMSVEEAHKKGAELKVELNSWLNEAVALGDVILGRIDNASKISDPVAKEAEMELSRQASYRQIELIKKIAQWELEYIFCAEDPDALKPGGWIYELKMKIRPSGVIWSTPVE